jgi:uncharacterized repeat protein (TIGR04138 family)
MEEIDFESDSFADIVGKDSRYDARAYAFLMDCVHYLGREGGRMSSGDVMYEFRERALDQYGPMAYTVVTEWGLASTEDIGEMMFNLVEFRRIRKDEDDRQEDFLDGFDFKEAFLGPYQS